MHSSETAALLILTNRRAQRFCTIARAEALDALFRGCRVSAPAKLANARTPATRRALFHRGSRQACSICLRSNCYGSMDQLEFETIKFQLQQENERLTLREEQADGLINETSSSDIKRFYDSLAPYSAGALSLSITLIGSYVGSNAQILKSMSILGVGGFTWLLISWLFLTTSLILSIGHRELTSYYANARGKEILLEARHSMNTLILAAIDKGFPAIPVNSKTPEDVQKQTALIATQVTTAKKGRKRYERGTTLARFIIGLSFVMGIILLATFSAALIYYTALIAT